MQISKALANRLLRNASSHERTAELMREWPASLPYTPPLPASTEKIAVVRHGARSYDLLQETALSFTAIQAFYINRLRLVGWQYYSAERRDGIALTGLSRKSEIAQSGLSFFHPGKKLVLRLHPIESDSTNRFLLSLEACSRSAELSIAARHLQLNLAPVPFLLPIEGGRYRNGSAGGNEQQYREVRLLESTQPLSQVFKHYQLQVTPEWQLESEQLDEQLSYGHWQHTGETGDRWRLSLCLTPSPVASGYAIFLSVEAVTPHYVSPTEDTFPIESALVEELLRVKHPDSIFYLNELPEELQSIFPVAADAEILAVGEQTEQQWMIWLKLLGSATDVYNRSAHPLEASGWQLVPSANVPNDIGFADSGFHAIAPAVFSQVDNPNQRLRLWTAPAGESVVTVEMLIDFLPDGKAYSFEPRKPVSGEQVESYPTLLLSPPAESSIYFSNHRMGLWEWSANAEISSTNSVEQLASHYGTELSAAGWQASSSQSSDSSSASVSSWKLSDKTGREWQALLQVATQDKQSSYAASLQVVTLNPSFA